MAEKIKKHIEQIFYGNHMPVLLLGLLLLVPILGCPSYDMAPPSVMRVSLWDWWFSNVTLGAVILLLGLGIWICRKKGEPETWQYRKTGWLLFLNALGWCTVFNRFVLDEWLHLPFNMLLLVALWCLSRAVLGRFFHIVWLPFLLIVFIDYVAASQGFIVSTDNMVQVLAASWHDMATYLSAANIALVLLAILLAGGSSLCLGLVLRRERRSSLLCCGSLCMLLVLGGLRFLEGHVWPGKAFMWPVGNLEVLAFHSVRGEYQIMQMGRLMQNLPPIGTTEAESGVLGGNEGVVCILHVGESACAGHMAFNGYQRNTTPWLGRQENLVSFPDCVASASTTDKAVVTMLTNGRRNFMETTDRRYLPGSPGLMDFFAATRFRCAAFLYKGSYTPRGTTLFAREMSFLLRCAHDVEFVPGTAWDQVPVVHDYISRHAGENLYLMLNNYGSHAFFTEYDVENPPFAPARPVATNDAPGENPEHAAIFTNVYDCTIHYTDEQIRRLLEPLKGKPYLYVYMSDHGEYVGQDGYWLRGKTPPSAFYQTSACQVPFFVLASPEFEALHPHFGEALQQLRANRGLPVGHEHLFHTVLGLLGIKTPYYDERLDLSSPQAKPYTGPHPSRGGAGE